MSWNFFLTFPFCFVSSYVNNNWFNQSACPSLVKKMSNIPTQSSYADVLACLICAPALLDLGMVAPHHQPADSFATADRNLMSIIISWVGVVTGSIENVRGKFVLIIDI